MATAMGHRARRSRPRRRSRVLAASLCRSDVARQASVVYRVAVVVVHRMARTPQRRRIASSMRRLRARAVHGDRSLMPIFVDPIVLLKNSPKRHFGEMFALRHYHEKEGWLGFASYALGDELPGSERRRAGRAKVEEIIPKHSLSRFQDQRAAGTDRRLGAGTPDLFLYDTRGRFKFVEVKKTTDSLRSAQFRCIAQIMKTLGCEVDLVYLREARQRYTPRTYLLDLDRCGAVRPSSNKALHRTGARVARPRR